MFQVFVVEKWKKYFYVFQIYKRISPKSFPYQNRHIFVSKMGVTIMSGVAIMSGDSILFALFCKSGV